MKKILFLSDLYYSAKGRKYYEEDIFITSKLKDYFHVLIGHPQQALAFLDAVDVIVMRNTGPIAYYKEYFQKFREVVQSKRLVTYNSLDGKGDQLGKQYLVDLTRIGAAVIPTVNTLEDLEKLNMPESYVVKPIDGADSLGLEMVPKSQLRSTFSNGKIVQPYIDFQYEVSFIFLDATFQYAIYAPDKTQRWALQEFEPSAADLEQAKKFVAWNTMRRGIQRIDLCRLKTGELLLVEIEDINPYLSLEVLAEEKKNLFINSFINALSQI